VVPGPVAGGSWPPSWGRLRLAAFGCFWLLLAAPGFFWLLLASSGCSWLLLAAPGCFWLVLAAPGLAASGKLLPDGSRTGFGQKQPFPNDARREIQEPDFTLPNALG